ncbi:MAG: hypothetical protein RR784_04800 [Burkholderiaceae bacterium]
MKTRHLAAVVLVVGVSACATNVPVVTEVLKCEPAEDIARRCELPKQVQEGITYGDLIKLMQEDRRALGVCANRHDALAKAIAACNQQIESHNQRLRGMSEANAKP